VLHRRLRIPQPRAGTPLLLTSADAADFYSKPVLANAIAQEKSV
jgi:hypothetical protein